MNTYVPPVNMNYEKFALLTPAATRDPWLSELTYLLGRCVVGQFASGASRLRVNMNHWSTVHQWTSEKKTSRLEERAIPFL